MSQKIYQIDAFADALFSGNPAAVCPLENWLDADIMQKIAAENNLAETAFTVPVENGYEIRWFTPEVEVDLCGHATLASAYIEEQKTRGKDEIPENLTEKMYGAITSFKEKYTMIQPNREQLLMSIKI